MMFHVKHSLKMMFHVKRFLFRNDEMRILWKMMIWRGLCLGVCCALSAWVACYFVERGFVIIHNHSNQKVQNVYMVYDNMGRSEKVWIGSLLPNQTYKHQINYADMNEFAVGIRYDLGSETKSETVVGYAADYDKQRYVFEIR